MHHSVELLPVSVGETERGSEALLTCACFGAGLGGYRVDDVPPQMSSAVRFTAVAIHNQRADIGHTYAGTNMAAMLNTSLTWRLI